MISLTKLTADVSMLSLLKRSITTNNFNKIGFIGTGNMAQAIISGLISKHKFLPQQIYVTDKDKEYVEHLKRNIPLFMVSK